jgi:hypothetical protein
MAIGKMDTFIEIISTTPTKDAEGFVTLGDNILASVRAFKENKSLSEKWADSARFATADALFRFRKIPGIAVDTTHVIVDAEGRYKILSVDNLRGRGMYVEVVAEKVEGSS